MECKSTKFFLNCNPLTAFHRGIFPLVQTASHAAEKISLYLSWSIGTTSNAPTVKSVNNRFHNYPMEHTYKPTFFVLSWIEKYLHLWGLSDFIANVITFVLACGLILLILWALNYIGTWTLTHVVTRAVRLSKTQWDDFLLHRHFFNRIIKCLTGVLLLVTARLIFAGYHPSIITAVEVLSRIFITVMGALTCGAFLNALNDIYESKPIARRKSIKGLIQAAKIALYFIMGIVVIAILINKDPTQLLVGLGASAAILSLVFKDTILGFIASIQISAQDTVRPGDWIEMPSKGADGIVTDINVTYVKVRNWNNTMTMLPIYSMVSEAFTNWRGMEESSGRQFKRPIYIDTSSLAELTPEQIEAIAAHPYTAAAANKMKELFQQTNSNQATLNIALFRCYAEAYLSQHPLLATDQTLVVRYLPFDENGIRLELYGSTTEKRFAFFERVVADMLNHLLLVIPLFGLKLYQRPSASVIRDISDNNSDPEPIVSSNSDNTPQTKN